MTDEDITLLDLFAGQASREQQDAAYLAAASPDVIQTLLAERDALEAHRDSWAALAIERGNDAVQFALERDALQADAQRYRRLGWLVEFGDWGVVRRDTSDSSGDTEDTWADDKAHMDAQLDSTEVVAEAESSRRALVAARGKGPTA